MKNGKLYLRAGVMAAITAVLAGTAFFFSAAGGLLTALTGLTLTALFIVYTLKRERELAKLSEYLYKVLNGIDALEVEDNEEGELSILKNNIRKTTLMLRSQAELLNKDKLWLSGALADISHQLKTPVTSILMMTDLLLAGDVSEDKRHEFLTNIARQTEKMQRLVVTLLKLSRFDAGTIALKKELINLKSVAEAALRPFLVQLELKGILLDTQLTDAYFTGDYEWTVEAVENIVKNCIEHMHTGGKLTLLCAENPLYTELLIRDTGTGIEKEDLPHIFERFYKGKNSAPDSVGIGLALSKSVFNRENARIEVKSEPGKGAEFRIHFQKTVL